MYHRHYKNPFESEQSLSDIFETDASVLEHQTPFSKEEIRQILAYSSLPDEYASIAVVARGKNIPLNDTVVRFNTMIVTNRQIFDSMGFHLPELLKKFEHGITSFRWIHSKDILAFGTRLRHS